MLKDVDRSRATIGMSNLGNTSGTTGQVSGSLLRYLFAGGNNVTLSQSINGASGTVTISAFTQSQESQTLGVSNLGNTAGTSGVVSGNQVRMLFAGGNNVTLSQSLNGSSGTITVSAFNQSQESNTAGISNLGNTAGTSGVISGNQIRFLMAGGNNVTLSQSIAGSSATVTVSAGSSAGHTHGKADLPAAVAYEDEANDFTTNQRIRSFLDVDEIAAPANPAANIARIYAIDEDGFTRLDWVDSTGIKLRLTRDNSLVVRNVHGSTISKGEVVQISGGTPGQIQVTKAHANSDSTMPAIGIALEAIANNAFGRVLLFGIIEGLDTSAFLEGDRLFVSAITAGALTTTQPVHPFLKQRVAVVLVSNVATGVLFFAPTAIRGDHEGTNKNLWIVGDTGVGAKSIQFRNNFTGDLAWNPSAARTVHLPDAGGTVALIDGLVNSAGVSNLGNTQGDTGVNTGRLVLVGSNNITLSQATDAVGRTVSFSGGAGGGGGGENTLGMSNLGNTAGTSGVISGSALRYLFAGGNNVTLSQSINGSTATLTVSAFNQTQESNTFGMSNLGQTVGTSGVVSGNQVRYLFAGTGRVSLRQSLNASSGTLTISVQAAAASLGVETAGNTAGTTGFVTGEPFLYNLAGGNNITLSQSRDSVSGTVTIIGATAASQTLGMSNLGNTAGTSGVISGSALRYLFAGGPNITLSQSINASTATLSISGGAGGGGGQAARSFFAICESAFLASDHAWTDAAVSKKPVFVPFWYDGDSLNPNTIEFYLTRIGGTSLLLTHEVGLYTFVDSTQISLLASATQAISLTTSAQFSGLRAVQFTEFSSVTLTQGMYVWAYVLSPSNNSTAVGNMAMWGVTMANPAGYIFSGTNSTGVTATQSHHYPYNGMYSATSDVLPSSVHRTQISGGNPTQRVLPYVAMKQAS